MSMLRTGLAVLLYVSTALCLLTACAPQTDKPLLPLTVPDAFSDSGESEIPSRWWRALGDAELNLVVENALQGNFDLQIVWHRLMEARAVVNRTSGPLYPDLEASLQRREFHGDGDFEEGPELQLGLSSVYEIDLWGRIRSAVEAEQYRAHAAQADYQTAALSLSAEIVRSWYRIAETRKQLELLERQVIINEQTLQLLENRFGVGLVPSVDILRQRRLLEATREQRYYASSRLEVFKHQLAVLSGQSPGTPPAIIPDSMPRLPSLPATGLPADLVQKRPDVRASLLQLKASDRDLAVAISNQFPRLTLSVTSTTRESDAEELFDDWLTTVGGELLAPLFRGGALRAEVQRTEAVRQQRLYSYGQTVLTAFREVEDALVREQRQRQGLDSLERQLTLARQAYEQLLNQYLNGVADYLDVLTAQDQLQQLERARLSAELTLVDYRVALYRALAGPFETSPEQET